MRREFPGGFSWHLNLCPRLCTRRIARLALPAHVESALLVARLLLTALIASNSLIGVFRSAARPPSRPWHALLPAMLATHVLLTFQIVLFRHALFSLRLDRMRRGADFQQLTETVGSEATALASRVSFRLDALFQKRQCFCIACRARVIDERDEKIGKRPIIPKFQA
jgi:hypothetical protein